jgi:hypothetical protein
MNRTRSDLHQIILMAFMLIFHELVVLVQLVLLIILIMLLPHHLDLIMIILILLIILWMVVHTRLTWFITLVPILIILATVILAPVDIVRFNFKIFLLHWFFTIPCSLFPKKTIFTACLAVGSYKIRSCAERVNTYRMPLIKISVVIFMSLRI